jgi:hypothetical protein
MPTKLTRVVLREHLETLLRSGSADGREDIRAFFLRRVYVLVKAVAPDLQVSRGGVK